MALRQPNEGGWVLDWQLVAAIVRCKTGSLGCLCNYIAHSTHTHTHIHTVTYTCTHTHCHVYMYSHIHIRLHIRTQFTHTRKILFHMNENSTHMQVYTHVYTQDTACV